MPMLPNVPDEQLEKALFEVVAFGWHLPERPASERVVEPLLRVAAGQPHELYPTLARRFLVLLDQALTDNAEPTLAGEAPLLNDDSSLGLRILFGTQRDYRNRPVGLRRHEAFGLLYPERTVIPSDDAIFKTWQVPMVRLALSSLRRSYGQEQPSHYRQHQSVRVFVRAVVRPDRHVEFVETSRVTRSLVEGLRQITIRLHHTRIENGIRFESLRGVGQPQVEHHPSGLIEIVFPLLDVIGDGETLTWSYRRIYSYGPEAHIPQWDHLAVTAGTAGYAASMAVTFEGDDVPSTISPFAAHSLQRPRFFDPTALTTVDDEGTAYFPETRDTLAGYAYGLYWAWQK